MGFKASVLHYCDAHSQGFLSDKNEECGGYQISEEDTIHIFSTVPTDNFGHSFIFILQLKNGWKDFHKSLYGCYAKLILFS